MGWWLLRLTVNLFPLQLTAVKNKFPLFLKVKKITSIIEKHILGLKSILGR